MRRTDPETFERNANALAAKVVEDLDRFRAMFGPGAEGMIRCLLLLHTLQETMPGWERIPEAVKLSGTWLILGCPETEEEFLRAYEGTTQ